MSLAPGARLGAFEIVSLVGAGGMGEVYRARDTRLGRDVAIKVIPAALIGDSDRLQRFEQEARATATLNHPNILAVYDIGSHDGAPYIVSELLDGETLRERVAAGPLPVRKAIELGIQIAQALAAAHGKGIVHRDLKPENIFINKDGRAKILDFGLAKLTQSDAPLMAGTNVPTTPGGNLTQAGVMLGTIGYMAPEQIRGQAVDHRADIFAFGAILYEMLSGTRAFKGDTTIDTVSAILKEDPPDLPVAERHIPPAMARIIDRCLEKSAALRFHSMHDLAIALETLSSHSESVVAMPAPAAPVGRQRAWLPWTLATITSLAAIAAGVWAYRLATVVPLTYRSTMLPPDGVVVDEPSPSRLIALSPDGRRLAFVGFGADRRRMLWVRSLDSLTAQQLNGTEDAFSPFWSPDSRNIGFFSGINGGKLKTVDLDGGPPTTLCDYLGNPAGADWSPDGVIFFSTLPEGSMRRVSAAGGASTVVIAPDAKAGESNFWWPVFLPDRQHFLYLTLSSGRTPLGVFVATLDGRERKLVLKGGSNVKYADGRLLFLRNTTLMAQPFDLSRLELEGDAVPIAEQIQSNPPTGAFTVSQTGILAYKTGEATGAARLTWYDTAGRQLGTVGSAAAYGDVRLAPDGKRATVSLPSPSAGGRDVWIVDLSRDLATRFTFDAAEDTSTIWSPDGTRIVYRSMRNGYADLYEKPSSGATAETLLLSDKSTKVPLSWSSDGKYILYGVSNPTDGTGGGAPIGDVWVLPLEGDRKPFPFLNSRFGEGPARFSPDGRWVAYQSNESGRPEVYVAPFPGPGGKWQVSTNGGGLPMWNPNGKEILFFAQTPGRLMTAPVTASAGSIDVGTVKPLFSLRPGGPRGFYDVAPDGRLLVIAGAQLAEQSPITLVVNWAGKSRD